MNSRTELKNCVHHKCLDKSDSKSRFRQFLFKLNINFTGPEKSEIPEM